MGCCKYQQVALNLKIDPVQAPLYQGMSEGPIHCNGFGWNSPVLSDLHFSSTQTIKMVNWTINGQAIQGLDGFCFSSKFLLVNGFNC